MSILDQIRQRAGSQPQHIVLPEGEDPRTVVAASLATAQKLARITVLGDEQKVRDGARQAGVDLGGVELIDHVRANDFEKMVSMLYDARRAKGMTLDEARTALRDPLYYGNLLVRSGRADGSVAVYDAGSGALVELMTPGTNGFVRIVMRGLARDRTNLGIGAQSPFQLTRWEDGRRMVEVFDKARLRLFVVKQNRKNPTLQLLKRAAEKRRFGRIYLASVNVFWTRPQEYYDAVKQRFAE